MELNVGQRVGGFSIINALGQGGMSNVYLARDEAHDRDVVLKFPHEQMMGDVATHERFSREVKIGLLLRHPHIQQLYEMVTAGSADFLVLEYVPGVNMRRWLRERNGARSSEDFTHAVVLGTQLADALAYAHSQHVAHRDLKPENIIIMPDGQAKVMDFGIAFLRGARRVTWGPLSSQVGTPDYMAPEQIQGGRGDSRTDVYALGMILYEFLTHHLPYQGDNALAVMNQHVNVKPPPLHQFRRDVPPGLEEVIMKAIRRKPQDRWPTMQAFSQALRDWQTVDAAALKAERDQEAGESAGLSRIASRLQVPASRVTLAVAAVLVLLMLLAAAALHFFGPHSTYH